MRIEIIFLLVYWLYDSNTIEQDKIEKQKKEKIKK